MSSVRIKHCGITSLDDAELCVDAGAWALGMILWPGSARRCSLEEAGRITRAMRRKVELTGVFVNEFGSMVLGKFSGNKATVAAWGNDIATFTNGNINWSDGAVWNLITGPLPLLVKFTDTNGAISLVQLLSRTSLVGRTGAMQGVGATRLNGKIFWNNGAVWDGFDFNALNALFEIGTGYP